MKGISKKVVESISKSKKEPKWMRDFRVNSYLKFESLDYNFKTKITEGKIAEVSGKCILNENVKPVKENSDFQNIIKKMKNAKTKDNLDKAYEEGKSKNFMSDLDWAMKIMYDDLKNKVK